MLLLPLLLFLSATAATTTIPQCYCCHYYYSSVLLLPLLLFLSATAATTTIAQYYCCQSCNNHGLVCHSVAPYPAYPQVLCTDRNFPDSNPRSGSQQCSTSFLHPPTHPPPKPHAYLPPPPPVPSPPPPPTLRLHLSPLRQTWLQLGGMPKGVEFLRQVRCTLQHWGVANAGKGGGWGVG